MSSLSAALFDYDLPPDRIAQAPAERRDHSRLLVVDRKTRSVAHRRFTDLPEYLRAGDTLIRNNASVLPARLHMRRPTGGHVECFLLAPCGEDATWRCLIRPGRRLPVGASFASEAGDVGGEIVSKAEDGSAVVRFSTPPGESVVAAARRIGEIPLPPYIARADGHSGAEDRERYQTVYADTTRAVAVAAPTAGLHFTPELLATLAAGGVRTADITLHVGLGTFKPIATDTIEEHRIHRELYEISPETQAVLFGGGPKPSALASGSGPGPGEAGPVPGRRIAVGTTSVRASEDFLAGHDRPTGTAVCAEAGLFIYPPRSFRGIDALVTNFHLPRSTLLCLVAAFLAPGSTDGIAWLHELYAEAIRERYRFLSYGDAMLIL